MSKNPHPHGFSPVPPPTLGVVEILPRDLVVVDGEEIEVPHYGSTRWFREAVASGAAHLRPRRPKPLDRVEEVCLAHHERIARRRSQEWLEAKYADDWALQRLMDPSQGLRARRRVLVAYHAQCRMTEALGR